MRRPPWAAVALTFVFWYFFYCTLTSALRSISTRFCPARCQSLISRVSDRKGVSSPSWALVSSLLDSSLLASRLILRLCFITFFTSSTCYMSSHHNTPDNLPLPRSPLSPPSVHITPRATFVSYTNPHLPHLYDLPPNSTRFPAPACPILSSVFPMSAPQELECTQKGFCAEGF